VTVYLDYDTVVAINQEHCGAGAGVRDSGALRGAVANVEATYLGVDLYPSIWDKAAVLLKGLAAAQNFHDGNKRTAYIAAESFLELNGVRIKKIHPSHQEVFVYAVAADVLKEGLAAEWFSVLERGRLFRKLRDRVLAINR
jgi:prophage maintenance system killer protein